MPWSCSPSASIAVHVPLPGLAYTGHTPLSPPSRPCLRPSFGRPSFPSTTPCDASDRSSKTHGARGWLRVPSCPNPRVMMAGRLSSRLFLVCHTQPEHLGAHVSYVPCRSGRSLKSVARAAAIGSTEANHSRGRRAVLGGIKGSLCCAIDLNDSDLTRPASSRCRPSCDNRAHVRAQLGLVQPS